MSDAVNVNCACKLGLTGSEWNKKTCRTANTVSSSKRSAHGYGCQACGGAKMNEGRVREGSGQSDRDWRQLARREKTPLWSGCASFRHTAYWIFGTVAGDNTIEYDNDSYLLDSRSYP